MSDTSPSPEPAGPDFTLDGLRHRHDGWTPQRQHDFIRALAESGCVTEACGAVGLSPSSAYRLRALPAATAFRQAWDVALDYAVRRLADAAFSRALHGVARPVFFQGQQVGERRYFDERLTQFLLRTRDPVRYGRWRDGYEARRHPDGAGIVLAHALNAVTDAAHGVELGDGDFDDDDDDEARDGERGEPAGFRMPPALDRGPPPPPIAPSRPDGAAPEEDDPHPLVGELFTAIRERSARIDARARRQAEYPDDEAGDEARAVAREWRSPVTVHRSGKRARRRRRGRADDADMS